MNFLPKGFDSPWSDVRALSPRGTRRLITRWTEAPTTKKSLCDDSLALHSAARSRGSPPACLQGRHRGRRMRAQRERAGASHTATPRMTPHKHPALPGPEAKPEITQQITEQLTGGPLGVKGNPSRPRRRS